MGPRSRFRMTLRPAVRPSRRLLLLVAVAAVLVAFAVVPVGASALPAFVHGAAQACAACHHAEPPSFQKCSDCHPDPQVPNQKCRNCHPGKTTTGAACWSCHAPGQQMPAPTDTNCAACHGTAPHLGASSVCTSCHSTSPTPHHDDIDQRAPACTECHQHEAKQSHDGQPCTACHGTDTHPSFPVVPAACNTCHPAERFNGVGSCTTCHAGGAFNGQVDNDIHDTTIPDAPISATSCTACHPGKQKHAGGNVACLDCHPDATPFHHGTATSPGFKDCASCHGDKPQHGSGHPCADCHPGAQHQSDPPRPTAAVCLTCHAGSRFGSARCFDCHKPPIYHAAHQVGGCSSCHGSGRAKHAGKVSCTKCHTNIDSGHHLNKVRRPSCTTAGCHLQQRHRGTVACTSCHGRKAMHDSTPLNLPADRWTVCNRCHTFATAARAAGVPACSQCHDTAQHSASYSVATCQSCHADKKLHAGKVACRLCHFSPGAGHHKVGTVGRRACSECHVDAEIHASATAAGAAFTCGTCHDGSVHGVVELPKKDRCLTCHVDATTHADGIECTDCHWPAAHAAAPDANRFGGFVKMRLVLPEESAVASNGTSTTLPGATTTTTAPGQPGRDTFAGTGAELAFMAAISALLMGTGLALRRRRSTD